jgi:hypothetical protein
MTLIPLLGDLQPTRLRPSYRGLGRSECTARGMPSSPRCKRAAMAVSTTICFAGARPSHGLHREGPAHGRVGCTRTPARLVRVPGDADRRAQAGVGTGRQLSGLHPEGADRLHNGKDPPRLQLASSASARVGVPPTGRATYGPRTTTFPTTHSMAGPGQLDLGHAPSTSEQRADDL